ncbi:MAG: ABC transporter permease [Spirochaetia bacterium]|nr:ABC transporter permease [Spirochaetia bacterium]
MNNSFLNLLSIHFKEYRREPSVFFWTIIFPVSLSLILGISFTKKTDSVKNVAVVYNEAGAKNQFFENLKTDYEDNALKINYDKEEGAAISKIKFIFVATLKEADDLLKNGQVLLILEGDLEKIVARFDPANQEAELTYFQLENHLLKKTEENMKIHPRPIHTSGLRYIDFLIPGLICLGIMNSALWGVGWSFIDLRIKKLLRRMTAAPMKKFDFLAAHFAARVVMSWVEFIIIYLFAKYYFEVKIAGSIAAIILVLLCGNFAFSGIGVLIGSRTSNSRIGNGLINAVSIPMMVLSGIFFNISNLPEAIQPVVKILPLTILTDILRHTFTNTLLTADVLLGCLYLIVTGIITAYSGLKIFRWY